MHKNFQFFFLLPPHSVCSEFPCGSRGGLRFAQKRREMGPVYLNVRYTTEIFCEFWLLNENKLAPADERKSNFKYVLPLQKHTLPHHMYNAIPYVINYNL